METEKVRKLTLSLNKKTENCYKKINYLRIEKKKDNSKKTITFATTRIFLVFLLLLFMSLSTQWQGTTGETKVEQEKAGLVKNQDLSGQGVGQNDLAGPREQFGKHGVQKVLVKNQAV